jgi:enoyl-CoA hydratase/carnithine racemase
LSSFVTFERAEHVGIITLDRPEALNALSGVMCDQLAGAFREVSRDPSLWVVILRANGDKAFCVGADLKERAGFTLEDFYENRKQIRGLFETIRKTPQPTIASVSGFALGGGFELALSCDLIVAAQGSKFGLPEARVGLLPAGGGTQLLSRKLGTSRAKELIYRGRRIDEAEARALGLVCDVTRPEELDSWTMSVALDICKSSPVAVRSAKLAIDGALGVPLDDGIELENEAWKTVIASRDRSEGISAFNEKRDADWTNT